MASMVICNATDIASGGCRYHALEQPRSGLLRNGLCATSHTFGILDFILQYNTDVRTDSHNLSKRLTWELNPTQGECY